MIALSEVNTIIETLQELERMHQLNLELLEQLGVVFVWILENDVPIPNKDKLDALLNKMHSLMKELYSSNSLKILQYQKIADENLQRKQTDEDFTEPVKRFCVVVVGMGVRVKNRR